MEKRVDGESEEGERDDESTGLIDRIRDLAAANARAPLASEESVRLYLMSWWSRTYNRPLKDPVLLSYSVEELLYEFYDKIERAKAATEAAEQETDKIEEKKEKAALDWAEEEEKRELEALSRGETPQTPPSPPSIKPSELEENKKWMEEQIRLNKKQFGEDFGDDIAFGD